MRLAGWYKLFEHEYNNAITYYQLGVKAGHGRSVRIIKNAFNGPKADNRMYYLALDKDPERVHRYGLIEDEIDRNSSAHFPDIDKIVPLPPAELPKWDGTFEYKKAQR